MAALVIFAEDCDPRAIKGFSGGQQSHDPAELLLPAWLPGARTRPPAPAPPAAFQDSSY